MHTDTYTVYLSMDSSFKITCGKGGRGKQGPEDIHSMTTFI